MLINFGKQDFELTPSGALYWKKEKMLLFADLHLEKGSFYAQHGSFIPYYDTDHTLEKMQQTINRYQPQKVVCLGDSFHDARAMLRMPDSQKKNLVQLRNNVKDWYWIMGNHDEYSFHDDIFENFYVVPFLKYCNILFVHEFVPTESLQIFGHFHPQVSVAINQHKIKGKCFAVSEGCLILPAFGSFTGGLNVAHRDFQKIFIKQAFQYYLLKNNKVWHV